MYIHAFRLCYKVQLPDGNGVRHVDSPQVVLTSSNINSNSNSNSSTNTSRTSTSTHYYDQDDNANGPNHQSSPSSQQVKDRTEELQPDEYIIEAHQEAMMERLIFTTNKRIIAFGVPKIFNRGGGAGAGAMMPPLQMSSLARRIVAFGGSCYKDRRLKIAYFTESVNWDLLRDLILVRRLVEDGRAVAVRFPAHGEFTREDEMMDFLIGETACSGEIFRIVLSCMAHDIK